MPPDQVTSSKPQPTAQPGLSLQVSVASTSSDHLVVELRRVLERFFAMRGYELDPGTPVEISTVIPVSVTDQIDDPVDGIDLHPTVEDEIPEDDVDESSEPFDIASSVTSFEKKSKFR